MPFKSEKQRRFLFKFKPEVAEEFASEEKKRNRQKMRKALKKRKNNPTIKPY